MGKDEETTERGDWKIGRLGEGEMGGGFQGTEVRSRSVPLSTM
jgi:hypothetical protein